MPFCKFYLWKNFIFYFRYLSFYFSHSFVVAYVLSQVSNVLRQFSLPNFAMEADADAEHTVMIEGSVSPTMQIDPRRARFPCCVVWTPLPIISWLVPFIGHIGICREDGVILDFAGPNFVCVDNFTFGSVTRYLQLSNEKVSTGLCLLINDLDPLQSSFLQFLPSPVLYW